MYRKWRIYFHGVSFTLTPNLLLASNLGEGVEFYSVKNWYRFQPDRSQGSTADLNFYYVIHFLECETEVDLGFLIDGSGSINRHDPGNFQRCLEFVKALTRAFVISPTGTRVGAILFSTRSRLVFDFNKYTTHAAVEAAINRIPYPHHLTYTGKALKLAAERLFDDVRPNVPRVLVVITDGASHDDVKATSDLLKESGVIITSVGLGRSAILRRFKPQLVAMASEPKDEHVFTADFPQMQSIVSAIQDQLCEG